MNSNFKRQTNCLQYAALMRGVIIVVFLGAAGLSYVYLKNQLHVSGVQRKALEQELSELVSENNVLEAQITRLTSRTALQRRIDEGFVRMVPITAPALVRVRNLDGGRWAADDRSVDSQIQTVSHEQTARR